MGRIEINPGYNQDLALVWPEQLQSLRLGNCFNQSLTGLPQRLQTLELGNEFNQSLQGTTDILCVFYGYLVMDLWTLTFWLKCVDFTNWTHKKWCTVCRGVVTVPKLVPFVFPLSDGKCPLETRTRNWGGVLQFLFSHRHW